MCLGGCRLHKRGWKTEFEKYSLVDWVLAIRRYITLCGGRDFVNSGVDNHRKLGGLYSTDKKDWDDRVVGS